MKYRLFVPKQAVGASLVYFDLFNAASSNLILDIESVQPVVSGEVAVTGVVDVDLFLTKTTAIGTGGTASTKDGTSLTACTITSLNNTQPIDGNVTARLTPTGGATAGAVLSSRCVFTEETNAGTYIPPRDMITDKVSIYSGQGIRIVQGGVASVGNIGFDVTFRVRNVVH
jgi:hypothetical protein